MKLVYDTLCGLLELVFKDYETNKVEIALSFFASHLLCLDPAELWYVLCSACNDSIASMRVVI